MQNFSVLIIILGLLMIGWSLYKDWKSRPDVEAKPPPPPIHRAHTTPKKVAKPSPKPSPKSRPKPAPAVEDTSLHDPFEVD